MKTVAVILSGGTGTRAGGSAPKQYSITGGRTMIERAMEPFFAHPIIDAVRVVADPAYHDAIRMDIAHIAKTKEAQERMLGFSAPGKTRALSIVNALRDLAKDMAGDDIVLIHDAARPFVSAELIDRLIAACKDADGALPVLPMKDTVYLAKEPYTSGAENNQNRVASLLEREKVVAGQAPEAFRFGPYLDANEALMPEKILSINGSTEVALLAGLDIALIDGEESNYKITSAQDMVRYTADCGKRRMG